MRLFRKIELLKDNNRGAFQEELDAWHIVLSIYYPTSADQVNGNETGIKYTELFRPTSGYIKKLVKLIA